VRSGNPIVCEYRGPRLSAWFSDPRTVLKLHEIIDELCPLSIITGITISIVGDVGVGAPFKQEFNTLKVVLHDG
jgi:hypothetical protein